MSKPQKPCARCGSQSFARDEDGWRCLLCGRSPSQPEQEARAREHEVAELERMGTHRRREPMHGKMKMG